MPLGFQDQRPRSAPVASCNRNFSSTLREPESTDSCESETDDDPRTPVNEDLTSDEFEWVRSSPILSHLLAGKELELSSSNYNESSECNDNECQAMKPSSYRNEPERTPSIVGNSFNRTPVGRSSPSYDGPVMRDKYFEDPKPLRRSANSGDCVSQRSNRLKTRHGKSPCSSNRNSSIEDDCSSSAIDDYMDGGGGGGSGGYGNRPQQIYFPPPPAPPQQPPPPCHHYHHPGLYHHPICSPASQQYSNQQFPMGNYRSPRSHSGLQINEPHHIRAMEYAHAGPYGQCHMYHYNSEFAMRLYATEPYRRRSSMQNSGSDEFDELREHCQRLESDKKNLTLQISVLNDQIDAQNEKIKDLESVIQDKQGHLNNAEEMLQHELLSKSSLETNKVNMMSNMTEIKFKLAQIEKQNLLLEETIKGFEIDNANLKLKILEKDSEIASLQSKIARSNNLSADSSADQIDHLQKKIDRLMASNKEKDQKLEGMTKSLVRKNKSHEASSSPSKRKSDGSIHADDELSDSALTTTPSNSRKSEASSSPMKSDTQTVEKPPPIPRHGSLNTPRQLSSPTATSTPIHSRSDSNNIPQRDDLLIEQSGSNGQKSSFSNLKRANSAEEINVPNKTPPVKARHAIKHYGTVPRQHAVNMAESLEQFQQPQNEKNNQTSKSLKSNKSSGVSFGKGFFKLRTNKRSSSAPNLAADTITPILPESKSNTMLRPSDMSTQLPDAKDKPKGFRKIFGKLRRSSSGGFDQSNEFKRGGMRATAGPRLGWSRDIQKSPVQNLDIPFSEWDKDQIALWLHSLGLTPYIGECKKWVKNGAHLLKARPQQLEKELGMKNALHRKKLSLALQAISVDKSCTEQSVIKMGELDYHWVTRWLDDIGIPQYKDVFNEARIDGRVLHYLTVEDLFSMKITNMLHHVCIKRGIHVLRANNYNPNCLRRRPIPGESRHFKLEEVALWTNHRVMEWLRSVDLSEYAPNLRGSGVHGAFMVYELKFNTDLLATLLSIPPSKTLLRRHLNTHFKELLGVNTIQDKRDFLEHPNFIPLTPSAKVKAVRRGQFTLRKKIKTDVEFEDYICPMSITCPSECMQQSNEIDQNSVKEIEAVSDEIDSLTTMLKDEAFLANMTTTNV
ncbi:Liprin-beta-1 [Nymphon striatum]|nr:Liprin-beta-1 [Nymphon striatum]